MGTFHSNDIIGTLGNDRINGHQGNDNINARAGNDTLIGGPGIDELFGGTGNDIYFVGNDGETVVEFRDDGFDTLHFTVGDPGFAQNDVTYALKPSVEIEVLDTTSEKAEVSLTGNEFNNQISGNRMANVLKGEGGDDVLNGRLAEDELFGGRGRDTFVFNSAIAEDTPIGSPYKNVDVLKDFTTFVDKIQLDKVIFANVKAAASHRLLASDFSADPANPGNAHFIYNKVNGRLFYDDDGAGRAADPIHFATVLSGPKPPANLTHFDILVV